MAATFSYSHFTLLSYLLLLSASHSPVLSIDITPLLSPYPDLADFSDLITTTSVAADLIGRSSITVLALPNAVLRHSDLAHSHVSSEFSPLYTGDVIRYHILLEYLSLTDLLRGPPGVRTVTTLFQATGRSTGNFGYVNFKRNSGSKTVTVASPAGNATVVSQIKSLPYNISILTVNSLLVPYGFDLKDFGARPSPGINITQVLIDAGNFNVVAWMLSASGVEAEFERKEGGAGITMLLPTDQAFSDLAASYRLKLQSLSAEQKADVLRFHILLSYYPLGSLERVVNPIEPTMATDLRGAGRFTLYISKVNGSVSIDTGIVQTSVIRTVIEQNPVAIFGVSKVLLPVEFFSKTPIEADKPGAGFSGTVVPPPEVSPPPKNVPGVFLSPEKLSSPSGLAQNASSAASKRGVVKLLGLWCIAFHLLLCR
ncbi:unnamed protein product [Cuscuta campestris]|uniref:FAS1 domain-containing protein n=1 Tax=Cuscuta campestris TaxID=132261 RepID=A0A484N9Y5_9ASTE|nr:unnamed protein product [Cuscuta campestris]